MTKKRATSALPAPLVPAGTTTDGFPCLWFDTRRFLQSDIHALGTTEELGAAILLWTRSWQQVPAGSLPNDPRVLASWAKVDIERWPKVSEIALRHFVLCSDGRLYHPVVAEEVLRVIGLRRFHSRRGRAGAAARWKKNAANDGNASSIPDASMKDASTVLRDGPRERPNSEPSAAAAAAGVARPPQGGATPPSESRANGAPGLGGPAPRAAAAAATDPQAPQVLSADRLNPDANAKLRAVLAKLGLPASPQAANEWEGFFRRKSIKTTAAKSFLVFCAKRGDVQFARFATESIIEEWRHGSAGADA